MSSISLKNNLIGNNYNKVINTEFNTFIPPSPSSLNQTTVEEFFTLYDELFYQIPKEGDLNSHNYILQKTIEYLGVRLADDESIQALLDEITNLRRQILEDSRVLNEVSGSL